MHSMESFSSLRPGQQEKATTLRQHTVVMLVVVLVLVVLMLVLVVLR